jgi:hypothetical protein
MKFNLFRFLLAASLVLLPFSSALAVTEDLVVDNNKSPGTFLTIQDAVNEANAQLTANNTKSYRIIVKASDTEYTGPVTLKNRDVPIIGERTDRVFLTSSSTTPIITVSNLGGPVEIRNLTFRTNGTGTTGILVSNSPSVSISNNVFVSNLTGTAIQVTGSTSTAVTNNTFYKNKVAISTNSDMVITNNIFSQNQTAIVPPGSLSQPTYNDYDRNTTIGVTLDSHSLPNASQADSNPRFVDPDNATANLQDFHLGAGSPAIGAGNPRDFNSFDASSSDMGAFGGRNADLPIPPKVTGVTSLPPVINGASASLVVSWNPTASGRVTAYRVYYGKSSGIYTGYQPVDGPSSTSLTLTGLPVTPPAQPTVPQNVRLLQTGTGDKLQVVWEVASGATAYRVYYGLSTANLDKSLLVPGVNSTSALLTGLTTGTRYYVIVRAVAQDSIYAAVTAVVSTSTTSAPGSTNESDYSTETSQVLAEQESANSNSADDIPEAPTPFPNLKGEGCFIATAAFGFYSAPQVQALRDFRDRFLLTNAPGRAFVAWYYYYGPKGAHFINQHPWLKVPVRAALLPLIVMALVLTGSGPLAKAALMSLLLAWLGLRALRRRTLPDTLPKLLPVLLLLLLPALAQGAEARPDRPHWSLELKGGASFPDVPGWSTYYGSSYTGEYGGALAYKLHRLVEVGIGATYSRASGKGQLPGHGGALAGDVRLEKVPLELYVLGRALFQEDQLVVPYLSVGYTRLLYREAIRGGDTVDGSVNGYHGRAGIQLLLDGLEADAARNLYRDWGIHHTYLFAEGKYLRADADTLGGGSVNLGGTSCLGGFLFEF